MQDFFLELENDEKNKRNIIEAEYSNYWNLYISYFNKCYEITKYIFINIDKQRKYIEAKNEDLNQFIKKMFNKVYVLNGISNIKRRFQMMEKMLLANISFNFFEIVEDDSPQSFIDYLESKSDNNFNEWCKCETLKRIITEIKNNNYDKALILDNNACLNLNIYNELKYDINLYKKWNMIIFNNEEYILNLKSFVPYKDVYDIILNNIYSKNKISDIVPNISRIEGIIKSDITNDDIIKYYDEDNKTYNLVLNSLLEKINNSDKNNTNINEIEYLNTCLKNLKVNKHINKYSYLDNNKRYNISFSYENMIDNFKNYYYFLENKKVALIGPSPSIRKTKNGEFIDQNYDVVVKMNNSIFNNLESEYMGKRIDVLYTLSIAQDLNQINVDPEFDSFPEYFFDLANKIGLKYIVLSSDLHHLCHNEWLFLHLIRFSEIYNVNKIPILFMEYSLIDEHLRECQKIPSAGFGGILNLTQYRLSELLIKGFTFFKDGHLDSYIGKNWKNKIDNANDETKKELTNEKKEKIIHSLVKTNYNINSPHHFDYEYIKTKKMSKKYDFIVFDDSIIDLYKI
jgi:hypothetical protein